MTPQSPQPHITVIILTAGMSSRYRRKNKLLLRFGKSTVLQTVIEAVSAKEISDIIVVTGHDREKIADLVNYYPVRIAHNSDYLEGIASSIRCGVSASSPDTKGFMICLGDMPLITAELLERLIEAFNSAPQSAVVIPKFKKRYGNPVVFSSVYRDELLQVKGDMGARSVYERHADSIVEVRVEEERVFFDVDTMKDYDLLKRLE